MKIEIAPIMIAITGFMTSAYGQVAGGGTTACESNVPEVGKLIGPVTENIVLECATKRVVVFMFTETNSSWGWTAIELLTNANYRLSEVITSGVGSEGNPTRFYAIMTK